LGEEKGFHTREDFVIQRWSRVIGFLIAAVFLALAFYNVDIQQVGRSLGQARYLYVLPALLCTATGYLLRTTRWKVILSPSRDIALTRLFPILIIGFTVNNLVPARVGELVRAYIVGEREHIAKSSALATIVVERVFVGLALVAILLVVASTLALPEWAQGVQRAAVLTFGVAGAGIALILVSEGTALRAMAAILRLLPSRLGMVHSLHRLASLFTEGFHALRSGRRLLLIALLSISIWGAEAASYFALTHAFDLPFTGMTRVWASLFLLTMINLGNLVPTAPGFIGGFQFFAILALGVFAVSKEVALSLAIVSHAMQYTFVTSLGVWFMSRYGMNLGVAQKAAHEPTGLAGPVGEGKG